MMANCLLLVGIRRMQASFGGTSSGLHRTDLVRHHQLIVEFALIVEGFWLDPVHLKAATRVTANRRQVVRHDGQLDDLDARCLRPLHARPDQPLGEVIAAPGGADVHAHDGGAVLRLGRILPRQAAHADQLPLVHGEIEREPALRAL